MVFFGNLLPDAVWPGPLLSVTAQHRRGALACWSCPEDLLPITRRDAPENHRRASIVCSARAGTDGERAEKICSLSV